MTTQSFLATRVFRGLNNVADPQRLGLEWQTTADNVDITQTGALARCRGYTRSTTNTKITGAYATKDLQRCYIVDNGSLLRVLPDMSTTSLRSGLSTLPMYFEEVNGVVFFTNGVDYGIALDSGVKPWGIAQPVAPTVGLVAGGSLAAGVYQFVCTLVDVDGLESANSPPVPIQAAAGSRVFVTSIPAVTGYTTNLYGTVADGTVFFLLQESAGDSYTLDAGQVHGRELPFWNTDTPRGSILAEFQGQMYVAETYPTLDQTAIWRSLPLHYHHFDPGGQGLSVPGAVRMLAGLEDALVIGTDRQIFAYDGDKLRELAPYGVVPGWHASKIVEGENHTLYFWSLRGLCRAMPFSNITESTVSVPPGLSAGGSVIEKDGMRRFVVAVHKGGDAFNRRIT